MTGTEQDNTDQISDYEAAIADEPEAEELEATESPARDERGRFAPKEQPEQVVEATPEVVPQERQQDHRIPLAELLNEREKRQEEQRQREYLQRELEQLRRQLQPPKQEPVPDQFANPEAYNQYWEQRLAEERSERMRATRELEANFSLRVARQTYGPELFDKAYSAVMEAAQRGDRVPAQQIANSPDPGETLVRWYKREQTLQTVGEDPNAYVQKALEEALNNPEFLAKALEKAKGVATAQPTQVKLPPSLNKATSASRSDDMGDISDAGIYRHAIGR